MNKNFLLISSSLMFLVFIVLYTNYIPHQICKNSDTCSLMFKYLKILFVITPALLLFSIINKFTTPLVFLSWKGFTKLYLFIYLLIVTIFPWYIGDGLLNIQKAHIAFLGVIIYCIISLVLIISKSSKKDPK